MPSPENIALFGSYSHFIDREGDITRIADLVREELMAQGLTAESLAIWIENNRFPGILGAWAQKYVADVRPFLEEVIEFNEEAERVLRDPKEFFQAGEDKARDLTIKYFLSAVNNRSPKHIKRAMEAHIELGLGNFFSATNHAGFAVNEKEIPNFGEALTEMDPVPNEVLQSLMSVEQRKVELLIMLEREFREANTPSA